MYNKILAPLDGSPLAESILPYARSLAKALNVRVELLHVLDPQVISAFVNPARGRYVHKVEAHMRNAGLDYLKQVANSFPSPPNVECSVEIGRAAEVILQRAEADGGALIAMATHGLSGVRRWILGSVVEKVLHMTSNPLLLVRPGEKVDAMGLARLKTVIVPLDGSGLAERVLPHVTFLAKKIDLEVVLLRIFVLPFSTYFVGEDYPPPDLARLTEEIREEARGYLDGRVEQLRSEGLAKVSSLLLEGNAAQKIIETAQQTADNLVAMCTHGRSGLSRLALGSVTSRVVGHSGDPVLVIRATDGKG
jgi:nucleotide-binding universal stress UspA family protein